MPEQEVTVRLIVDIQTYGDPEKISQGILRSASRAIHHAGHNFEVALDDPDLIERIWYRYDPLGDDMGNHGDDHAEPLIESRRETLRASEGGR